MRTIEEAWAVVYEAAAQSGLALEDLLSEHNLQRSGLLGEAVDCILGRLDRELDEVAQSVGLDGPTALDELKQRRSARITERRRGRGELPLRREVPSLIRRVRGAGPRGVRVELGVLLAELRLDTAWMRRVAAYTLGEFGAAGLIPEDAVATIRITLEMYAEQDRDESCRVEAWAALEKIARMLGPSSREGPRDQPPDNPMDACVRG